MFGIAQFCKLFDKLLFGGRSKINCFHAYSTGGSFDQKSPYFQDEFPSLATGGEEKGKVPGSLASSSAQAAADGKRDEKKDPQYGPGPSLRPQSECISFLVMGQMEIGLNFLPISYMANLTYWIS